MPVIWCGYQATLAYSSILREGLADFVELGPGEQAAVDLAEALTDTKFDCRERRSISVPNVARIMAGAVVVGRRNRALAKHVLPPVLNYDLIDVPGCLVRRPRTLQYVSSYGCPHACTFCAEPEHSGRLWKALPPARVVKELLALWRRYRPDRIGIIDPSFSTRAPRVVAIAEFLRQSEERIEICCDMRATDVLQLARLAALSSLKDEGFQEVYIGIETGSDRQLQRLKKQLSADDAFEACRLLDNAGIRTITRFIYDLPDETIEDSHATMTLARRLAELPGNSQRASFL